MIRIGFRFRFANRPEPLGNSSFEFGGNRSAKAPDLSGVRHRVGTAIRDEYLRASAVSGISCDFVSQMGREVRRSRDLRQKRLSASNTTEMSDFVSQFARMSLNQISLYRFMVSWNRGDRTVFPAVRVVSIAAFGGFGQDRIDSRPESMNENLTIRRIANSGLTSRIRAVVTCVQILMIFRILTLGRGMSRERTRGLYPRCSAGPDLADFADSFGWEGCWAGKEVRASR